jgi:hypothetical protein
VDEAGTGVEVDNGEAAGEVEGVTQGQVEVLTQGEDEGAPRGTQIVRMFCNSLKLFIFTGDILWSLLDSTHLHLIDFLEDM